MGNVDVHTPRGELDFQCVATPTLAPLAAAFPQWLVRSISWVLNDFVPRDNVHLGTGLKATSNHHTRVDKEPDRNL